MSSHKNPHSVTIGHRYRSESTSCHQANSKHKIAIVKVKEAQKQWSLEKQFTCGFSLFCMEWMGSTAPRSAIPCPCDIWANDRQTDILGQKFFLVTFAYCFVQETQAFFSKYTDFGTSFPFKLHCHLNSSLKLQVR